jgi:hypothetical protein
MARLRGKTQNPRRTLSSPPPSRKSPKPPQKHPPLKPNQAKSSQIKPNQGGIKKIMTQSSTSVRENATAGRPENIQKTIRRACLTLGGRSIRLQRHFV